MKKLVLYLLVIFSIIFLSTCNDDNTLIKLPNCPTCADNVSWDGYGEWKFLGTGYDGLSVPDGIHIEKDCGWKIYWKRVGGIGSTYEVYSCDTAVVFIWEWSNFRALQLRENWAGATKEGVHMGDILSIFLSIYKKFEPVKSDSTYKNRYYPYIKYLFQWDTPFNYISAGFSSDRKLNYLYIYKKTGYEEGIHDFDIRPERY